LATIPPDNVAAGQAGHIVAHQQISDALQDHESALGALPVMAWGVTQLTGGTVSVTLPAVGPQSIVIVSRMTPSGNTGHLAVPTVSPGTGFTITSSNNGDNSQVAYLVLGPATS
jgi:selenophosphate synthase